MKGYRVTGYPGAVWTRSASVPYLSGFFDIAGHTVTSATNRQIPRKRKPTLCAVRLSSARHAERSIASQNTVVIRKAGNASYSPSCLERRSGGCEFLRSRRSGFPCADGMSLALSMHRVVDRTASGTAVRHGISSYAQLGGGRDFVFEEGDRYVCRAQGDPPSGCCA